MCVWNSWGWQGYQHVLSMNHLSTNLSKFNSCLPTHPAAPDAVHQDISQLWVPKMPENHLSSAANKRPLLSHYDLQAPELPSFRIECRNAIQCFVRLSTRTLSKIRVKLSCRNGEVLILNNPFGQAHLHSSSYPQAAQKVRTSANSSPSQMIAPVVPTASESKSTISWSEPHHCHPKWPKIFINFPVTFLVQPSHTLPSQKVI